MKYRFCKFCRGSGCLACPGEQRKAEKAEAAAISARKQRYAAMTPEQIIAELPKIREVTSLADSLFRRHGTNSKSAIEIEQSARSQVLKNLEDGGHEWPMPEPALVMTATDFDDPEKLEALRSIVFKPNSEENHD